MQNVSNLIVAAPADTVVLKDTPAAQLSLSALANERKQWEANAYRTSNQQLYALLARCYSYYLAMREDSDAGKALRKDLATFVGRHGIRISPSSHGIARILKCVFFDGDSSVDRRRISTYSIVLRRALSDNFSADKVAEFIEGNGGVQEVRLASAPNAKSAKVKATLGQSSLETAPVLAKLRTDALSQKFDATDFDRPVALLGVLRANGEVEVRAVVRAQGALTAALAAHYTAANDGGARKSA